MTESTTIYISEESKLEILKKIRTLQEKHIFLSTTQIDNVIDEFTTFLLLFLLQDVLFRFQNSNSIQGKTTCQIHAFLDLINLHH